MEYAIGILLALIVTGGATAVGFDRERVFYPCVSIVVATYYILFAAMGDSARVVIAESVAAGVFLMLSVIGFKSTLWLVAIALGGHGLFDFVHHLMIDNLTAPVWWPGFCLAFDVSAAGYLAALLTKRPHLARQAGPM